MATTYSSPAVRSALKLYPTAFVGLRGLEREQEYHELNEVLVSYIGALEAIEDPEFTTTTLPDGVVAVAYEQTVVVTGGGALVITLKTGTLPDGLELSEDGVISGIPAVDGTSTFTLTATNQASAVDQELTIIIAAA